MQDFHDLVFITGNQYKADFLAKWIGRPVEHRKVDLDELQSLDPRAVVEDKARRAYDVVKKPVLVEDVTLTFTALGHLPGTLIRWFLEDLGPAGLCNLAHRLEHQLAVAAITYALYDGEKLYTFEGDAHGTIAPEPRGESFGWNVVFIPDGFDRTYGEMTDEEFMQHSHRGKALRKLKAFLEHGGQLSPHSK